MGQCSLTVALPILSAYGVETCVLPTAVLSNHTMFKSFSYLDLYSETENIFSEWERNGFKFDAFLLGYLGKASWTTVAKSCFDRFSKTGAKIIIDPVFGDDGRLYGGFDLEYVEAMKGLISCADVILPNVTEACFLTGTPYVERYDEEFLLKLGDKLSKLCSGAILITGAEINGEIGELARVGGKVEFLRHTLLPVKKHGTGDIFAARFTAAYMGGNSIFESCNSAAEFVADCIKITERDHFYGVDFEKILNGKN